MPEFVPDFDLSTITPAEYNPRHLSEEAFDRLCLSLQRFGLVKPIIVNGDRTIVAGHQRTKAALHMGIAHGPVMVLDQKASLEDEINFNLTHNSIEVAQSSIFVPPTEEEGYVVVDWKDIQEETLADTAHKIGLCGKLVTRYGAWGNVVADPDTGRIIANTDYAAVIRRVREPLLVYYAPFDHVAELEETLHQEFGVYDASVVMKDTWQQFAIQPDRLAVTKGRPYLSVAYEFIVMKELEAGSRFLDFGAGKQEYVHKLRAEGWRAFAYEPFLYKRTAEGRKFNLPHIVSDIRNINDDVRRNGLYPTVVLDSVLNASSTEEYHLWITLAAMSFMRSDGQMFVSTRAYEHEVQADARKSNGTGFLVHHAFITPEGRSVAFRNHQWTTIRFHTEESLKDWLERYFDEVTLTRKGAANHTATVRKPKPMPEDLIRRALNEELNMTYPGGFKHNEHGPLVDAVIHHLYLEGRLLPTGATIPSDVLRPPLAIGKAKELDLADEG